MTTYTVTYSPSAELLSYIFPRLFDYLLSLGIIKPRKEQVKLRGFLSHLKLTYSQQKMLYKRLQKIRMEQEYSMNCIKEVEVSSRIIMKDMGIERFLNN